MKDFDAGFIELLEKTLEKNVPDYLLLSDEIKSWLRLFLGISVANKVCKIICESREEIKK